MAAPTSADLAAFLGRTVNPEQGNAVLLAVTAMASAYTRGEGFAAGVPNNEIRSVILMASARVISNSRGLEFSETYGPQSISFQSAFESWTTAELFVLNRYRVRAR